MYDDEQHGTIAQVRISALEKEIERLRNNSLDRRDFDILLAKLSEVANSNKEAAFMMEKAQDTILSRVSSLESEVAALSHFVTRWKGAAVALMMVGAAISFLISQAWNFWRFVVNGG